MAERRMFAKALTGSARFLRMPATSRLLYYDLGMAADDDGCVEAFSVMRMTGATEDDLRLLHSKGFVVILNEDLVSYLPDWQMHNNIRADRITPSIYRPLLLSIIPDAVVKDRKHKTDVSATVATALPDPAREAPKKVLKEPENGSNAGNCQTSDRQVTDNCQTSDSQVTAECPHRIGKDRIGKVRLGKDSNTKGDYSSPDAGEPAPDEHPSFEQVRQMYNGICKDLPQCTVLSEHRKKAIRARLRSGYTLTDFQRLFELAQGSAFLRGANDRSWTADFDWLIKDSNMAKVLDGRYTGAGYRPPAPSKSTAATVAMTQRVQAGTAGLGEFEKAAIARMLAEHKAEVEGAMPE